MPVSRREFLIGAGGAGLRAAIEAHDSGARVAVVCKSLLGKAHTVMAEGGIAAAMGNLYPDDNWKVHFRDTMRGGKMLNHYRMAELHAKEAPDRVRELEDWGALFDRTKDGLIRQRDFGGHRFARLAHVGDRTGLELIRTLQQRVVALGIDVFMEHTVTRLLTGEDGAISGAFGYRPAAGALLRAPTPPPVPSTGPPAESAAAPRPTTAYDSSGLQPNSIIRQPTTFTPFAMSITLPFGTASAKAPRKGARITYNSANIGLRAGDGESGAQAGVQRTRAGGNQPVLVPGERGGAEIGLSHCGAMTLG